MEKILENVNGVRVGDVIMMPEGKSLVTHLTKTEINTLSRIEKGIILIQRWIDGKTIDYLTQGQDESYEGCSELYSFRNKLLKQVGI